ncbi:alpha/beta fold hydrolase [Streptacidiphilus monticola]
MVHGAGGTVEEFALAPDGRRAVTIAASHRLAMTDELYLVVDGGEPRLVTDPDEPAQYHSPAWLGPDGAALLVTTCRGREFTGLARFKPDTEAWSWLLTDDTRDLVGWPSPDGRLLLVMANDDGQARLSLHDAASGALHHALVLPGDAHQDGWAAFHPQPKPAWSADSRYVVLSYADAAHPGDVLRVDAAEGTVTVVASSGGASADAPVARPVAHRVPTPDGEQIPCFVYRSPAPADPALAASAVLVVHGGPEGQAVRGFNVLVQAFAAAGHTVVVPNVRGSRGYGKRWYSLDDKRLRLDSVADLAALHAWLPSIGVDPERAALYGGSYGGYMVLAGLAFQPDLWAAGVDVVGLSSLVTFLENTSAYRRAVREREYGTLEHDRDSWSRHPR